MKGDITWKLDLEWLIDIAAACTRHVPDIQGLSLGTPPFPNIPPEGKPKNTSFIYPKYSRSLSLSINDANPGIMWAHTEYVYLIGVYGRDWYPKAQVMGINKAI